MLFCLFKARQKKKKKLKKRRRRKKKTICVFHGVEHYQQTEKNRFRPKMSIALACCKNYYLKNNTQNRFDLLSIFFLWFCLLEAQNYYENDRKLRWKMTKTRFVTVPRINRDGHWLLWATTSHTWSKENSLNFPNCHWRFKVIPSFSLSGGQTYVLDI